MLNNSINLHLLINTLLKLNPLHQIKNPIIFTVYVSSIMTTGLTIQAIITNGGESVSFVLVITCWLWFTLLIANFAEAIAEARGKAQAASLRKTRHLIQAKKLEDPVNKAAFTGESAPVIRESGGDRSAVTGGTKVISDWLIIKITANPGETFLDHMINLIEGARRQKTPNEIALSILLATLTIIFLLVCATLLPYSIYSVEVMHSGKIITTTVLIALFVCLAPTTIGGLISAIGIAGMDRMIQRNVIALSGRAIEAAGDVNVLLLDKTGTITLGNRQASEFIPIGNVPTNILANAAQLSSLADETIEGRSIVVLAKEKYGIRGRNLQDLGGKFIPFSAQTRMSGVTFRGYDIRKGAPDAIIGYINSIGGQVDSSVIFSFSCCAYSAGISS